MFQSVKPDDNWATENATTHEASSTLNEDDSTTGNSKAALIGGLLGGIGGLVFLAAVGAGVGAAVYCLYIKPKANVIHSK